MKPDLPTTVAEDEASYSYIPLDPLPVDTRPRFVCSKYKPLLDSLPDEAVRIAVGSFDGTGSLSFGPAKMGIENHTYQVVLDYIDVDEGTLTVEVKRTKADGKLVSVFDTSVSPKETRYAVTPGSASIRTFVQGEPQGSFTARGKLDQASELVNMPVYLGVGLRLTATVRVLKGTANLSSLGALAAAAEVGTISGSLVVQTLGINGKGVSTSLPLPSELNQTTIQNAILALGSIKAILYDEKNTIVTPRVVGIYNPVGGGQQFINGIISALAVSPVSWSSPCASPVPP